MITKVDIGYLITHLFKSDKHLWDAIKALASKDNEVITAVNDLTTNNSSNQTVEIEHA